VTVELRWAAVYEGRVWYRWDETPWVALPAQGMLGVIQFAPHGYRTLYSSGDWYWCYEGRLGYVRSPTAWGTWALPPEIPCKSCVKQGVTVSDEEFQVVYQLMRQYRIEPVIPLPG